MELRVAKVTIKKNCRKVHGVEGAIDEAFRITKEKYLNAMSFDINKDESFVLELIVNRDIQWNFKA